MDSNNTSNENRALHSPIISMTPKDSITSPRTQFPAVSLKKGVPISKMLQTRKAIPTKTMVKNAIKTILMGSDSDVMAGDSGRKRITLQGIQKFMAQHYFTTSAETKSRMRYVKKFINELLGSGQLKRLRGVGFSGSFWVPSKSALKRDKQAKKKVRKSRATKKEKAEKSKSKSGATKRQKQRQ